MGAVYLAWDPDLEREVAIKVLVTERLGSGAAVERFAAEARALAALSNPHVVLVYEFVGGEHPYLVMEHVRGLSLRQLLQARGPQPLRVLRDCAKQVLAGLRAAHEARLLHRDLKPANILLSSDGTYKLVDFGLARHRFDDPGQGITASGEVVGTVRYLAPELAIGGDATPRSDLYALGLTLLELALGCHPVPSDDNSLRLLRRIAEQPLPAISILTPDLPAPLVAWLERLLAHDPTSRFASAEEASAALAVVPDPGAGAPIISDAPTTVLSTGIGSGSAPAVITGTHRPVTSTAPSRPDRRFRTGFVLKFTLAIWLTSGLGAGLGCLLMAQQARASQLERLRADLVSAATAAAALVDGDAHAALAADPREANPAFIQVREDLRAFRGTRSDLGNIYTLMRLPESDRTGVVAFTCDAADESDENGNGVIDPNEANAEPGQRYDGKPCPAMLRGFTAPSADDAPVRDQYGLWLSGYAPIRTRTGATVGAVGIDIDAAQVDLQLRPFLATGLALLIATLVASWGVALLLALRLRQPIRALQKALGAAADGDLSIGLPVRGSDEFRDVAEDFNRLAGKLRAGANLRDDMARVIAGSLCDAIAGRNGSSSGIALDGPVAVLRCDLDPLGSDETARRDLLAALPALTPGLLAAVQAHAGRLERTNGSGFLVLFPDAEGQRAEERAIRAGLAVTLACHGRPVQPRIAIARELDALEGERRAIELVGLARSAAADLVACDHTFAAVAGRFYADRIVGATGPAWAVKGVAS